MLVIFEKKIKVKEGGGGFKKRFVCVIDQNNKWNCQDMCSQKIP